MNIAVLNECSLTSEEISELKKLGNVSIFSGTTDEGKLIEELKSIDIAIIDAFLIKFNENILKNTPNLKLVIINSTGYDMLDKELLLSHNIKACNVPGYATKSVAEHTIALLFAIVKHIPYLDKRMRQQPFIADPTDENKKFLSTDLKNKTLGVIGLGTIGKRVAEIGQAIGMNVIAYNRTPQQMPDVKMVTMEELLQTSDVVTLHLALSSQTDHIIGEKELNMMKDTAYIINTARGKHIDNSALYTALKNKRITGAGLDVLTNYSKDNPLLSLDNVVLTPHSAYYSKESLENMGTIIVKNVKQYIEGNPVNLVI